MKAVMKEKTFATGDAIIFQIQIKGQGNFTVINSPVIPVPEGMEAYDPLVKESVDKTVYPLSGLKTFEYTFIAKDTGMFKIPSVVFSYFDPTEARYKTVYSDSFRVHIIPPGKKKASGIKIVFPGATLQPPHWIDAISINTLIGSLAVIFFTGLGIYHWKKSRQERKAAVLNSRPTHTPTHKNEMAKRLKDPLLEARLALQEDKGQQFYREINNAIWQKLSSILNIPSSELNKFNAVSRLRAKGADMEMILRLESVLNECEIALYTPVHAVTDMQQILLKTESVIQALEKTPA
jgi:hypothetical protein